MAAAACWTALIAWACWAGLNVSLMLLTSFVVQPSQPCFTGFRVVIPAWVVRSLNASELEAITAHELGHRAHWHAWKNFAAVCVFMPASAATRLRQEHEADDYAAERGHGAALASALARLSTHPNDIERAARLLRTT